MSKNSSNLPLQKDVTIDVSVNDPFLFTEDELEGIRKIRDRTLDEIGTLLKKT